MKTEIPDQLNPRSPELIFRSRQSLDSPGFAVHACQVTPGPPSFALKWSVVGCPRLIFDIFKSNFQIWTKCVSWTEFHGVDFLRCLKSFSFQEFSIQKASFNFIPSQPRFSFVFCHSATVFSARIRPDPLLAKATDVILDSTLDLLHESLLLLLTFAMTQQGLVPFSILNWSQSSRAWKNFKGPIILRKCEILSFHWIRETVQIKVIIVSQTFTWTFLNNLQFTSALDLSKGQ